jgi:hypothetical protein
MVLTAPRIDATVRIVALILLALVRATIVVSMHYLHVDHQQYLVGLITFGDLSV